MEQEVQKFIRCAGLTEKNLNRLERRMEKHVGKTDDDNASTVTGVSAYSMRSTITGVSKYSEAQTAEETNAADLVPPGSATVKKGPPAQQGENMLPSDDPGGLGVSGMKLNTITEDVDDADDEQPVEEFHWVDLDKYAAYLHERDAILKKEQTHNLQYQLKRDLDQQVADNLHRKQMNQDNNEEYLQNQADDVALWKQEEKDRLLEMRKRYQKEKVERDEQLRLKVSAKKEEKEKRVDEERQLNDKINQELEALRQVDDRRRQQLREAMREIWKSEQPDEGEKKRLVAQQQEEERNQMKEYLALLEQKEKQKSEDSKKRIEDHAKRLKEAPGKKDELKEKEMSDTAKAAIEQEKVNQKAIEQEREKRATLKVQRLDNQLHLLDQMREKQNIRNREQQEKLILAQQFESDAASWHSEEKAKVAQRRARNLEHRKELEKQIKANKTAHPSQRSGNLGQEQEMSACEVKMNRQLIAEVKSVLRVKV